MKLIDFSPLYQRFKEKDIYNDLEIDQKVKQANEVLVLKIDSLVRQDSEPTRNTGKRMSSDVKQHSSLNAEAEAKRIKKLIVQILQETEDD